MEEEQLTIAYWWRLGAFTARQSRITVHESKHHALFSWFNHRNTSKLKTWTIHIGLMQYKCLCLTNCHHESGSACFHDLQRPMSGSSGSILDNWGVNGTRDDATAVITILKISRGLPIRQASSLQKHPRCCTVSIKLWHYPPGWSLFISSYTWGVSLAIVQASE